MLVLFHYRIVSNRSSIAQQEIYFCCFVDQSLQQLLTKTTEKGDTKEMSFINNVISAEAITFWSLTKNITCTEEVEFVYLKNVSHCC